MPDISQIELNGTTYDIKDAVARTSIDNLDSEVDILRAQQAHPVVANSLTNADTTKIYIVPDANDNNKPHWYHYNGSTWVNDGVWGSAVPVDDKLETAGAAADAKVTGEKIGNLKSALDNGIMASREFVVAANTIHSTTTDPITLNIKAGESFGIIKNHGGIIAYYEDGTSATIMLGSVNNDIIVAAKNIKELGVYYDNSSGNTAVTCFIFVLRSDAGLELYSTIVDRAIHRTDRLAHEDKEIGKGFQTFWEYGSFVNGGLKTNGTIEPVQPYRISSNSHIIAPYNLLIHVATGFRWGYISFVEGSAGSWLGWYTSDIKIPANTEFVIQIARVTEDTSEIANVDEFINAITFDAQIKTQIYEGDTRNPDLTNNADLHFTWYYSNPYLNKVTTTDYSVSNLEKILISKGTRIYCDSGYRYKYYLYNLDNSVSSATNTWLTTETTINQDGYLYFSFAANNGSATQTLDTLLPHLHIVSEVNKDVSLLMNEIQPLIDNYDAEQYDYVYEGAKIPTHMGRYNVETTRVVPPAPYPTAGGITIESATSYQGFAYYSGVVIQLYSTNACALIDYATHTVIGTYETETLHGNSIDFLNQFENTGDEFPLAIISDGLTNKAFKVKIDRTNGITILENIIFPLNKCGYYASTMVDALNNVLYTIGYTENSYNTNPSGTNDMIIAKWDLNDMDDNGDNTSTPAFIESFTVPFIITLQGPCYFNGLLYIVSSHWENTNTLIYVIDPHEKSVRNIITQFPPNIKAKETEGIYFAVIDGETKGLLRNNQGGTVYCTITFNS